MLERYRRYLRLELVLALLAVAAALAIIYLLQQLEGLPEEENDLERQIRQKQSAMESLVEETLELQQTLSVLEVEPEPPPFPSRADATSLGTAVSAFISEQGLSLLNFSTSRSVSQVGEEERPVISYMVAAQGDATPLVGIVSLIDAVPMAVVESLDFSRESKERESEEQEPKEQEPKEQESEEQKEWVLNLSMIVYYSGQ